MKNSSSSELMPEADNQTINGGKFLGFYLGKEEYAIEILKVQEIIGMIPIVPIPNMPTYICGVINLRGNIIPVMNLRQRFGLSLVDNTDESCIIILQQNTSQIGILVDRVSEVVTIEYHQIEPVPSFGIIGTSEYLAGIGKVKDAVKLIVEVQNIFDVPENVMSEELQIDPEDVDNLTKQE